MATDPREYMQRLQRALQQRQGGFGGGMPSGGPAAGRGLVGLIALGIGGVIISNSIFNVDGGHRAIKYTRIGMDVVGYAAGYLLTECRWCEERHIQ